MDSDFNPYVYDEYNADVDGRQTSIGFLHKRALSTSAINLTKRPRSVHPERKHREQDIRYQSTPNFVKLNKKSLAAQPQHKHIYFPILKRKQKGIVKVYNNTNIMRKTFSLENIEVDDDEPLSIIDRNLLTPLPIDNDAKRHKSLIAHQKESRRKRKAMRQRGLSPTSNKDDKPPGRKRMTDRERREMFGLIPKRPPKKKKEEDEENMGDPDLGMGMAINLFTAPAPSKRMTAIRNITSMFGKKKETGPPPPTTPAKPKAIDMLTAQMMARNVLSRNIKARVAKRVTATDGPPRPLVKQLSKQSLMSIDSLGSGLQDAAMKKSHTSLKSLSRSIRTVASFASHRSSSIDEEAAEAADKVPKLESEKKDLKKKMQSGMSKLTLTNRLVPKQSRVTSAKGAKTTSGPSRSASKASLRSVAASAKTVDSALSVLSETSSKSKQEVAPEPPKQATPKEAPKQPPLSKFSIASMTAAAITSQPLQVTTTITNELARQGAEKKEGAVAGSVASQEKETTPASSQKAEKASSASQKAEKAETQSISSIKTMASIRSMATRKTDSKPSSRKTSAKKERATSSRPGSRIFISAANTAMAVRAMMRSTRSNDSIDSIHSDATQITLGQGNGADNQDVPSTHLSGKMILERSQKTLEQVQLTVNNATNEIHKTISENLTDLKSLEHKLNQHLIIDANNNDEVLMIHNLDTKDSVSMRSSRAHLSRHSTKIDMQTPARQAAQGASTTHLKSSHSKTSLSKEDTASINAINVMPDAELQMMQEQTMMEDVEEGYEEDEMGSGEDMDQGLEMR